MLKISYEFKEWHVGTLCTINKEWLSSYANLREWSIKYSWKDFKDKVFIINAINLVIPIDGIYRAAVNIGNSKNCNIDIYWLPQEALIKLEKQDNEG